MKFDHEWTECLEPYAAVMPAMALGRSIAFYLTKRPIWRPNPGHTRDSVESVTLASFYVRRQTREGINGCLRG